MLTGSTVRDYVNELASDAPAPGGGSAAALVGALGAALGEMVANFTVGKKKYADVEDEISEALNSLTRVRGELLNLTDRDADAYSKVGEAYGMPKDTREQKQDRAVAIQGALEAAADVPAAVVRCCRDIVGELPVLVDKGNRNLVSDAGVAAKLALAAAECAWLNVEINVAYMNDDAPIDDIREPVEAQLEEIRKIAPNVWVQTVEKICG